MRISHSQMIKLCLKKASELVDVINTVPQCHVYKVLKAEPLYENTGAIRLDVTFSPQAAGCEAVAED